MIHPPYTKPERLPFFKDRFKGSVVAITGVGNNNLGSAVAARLLQEGAMIAIYDVHEAGIKETQERLRHGAPSDAIYALAMDVADAGSAQQAIQKTFAHYGRIDAFIHCAGITGDTGKPVEASSDELFESILKINLHGSRNVTKALIPIFKQQGYGRVLLVASIAGLVGNPNMIAYATSKAGVIGIVKSVGEELSLYAKENPDADISISGIAPVVIQTPMVDKNPESVIDSMKSKIPMGRFATLDEFAARALFIISAENSGTQGFVEDLSLGRRRQ